MTDVYVVTTGHYSDYTIVQVFADEPSADKYAELLNAQSPYTHADVGAYTLRGPDFQMPYWAGHTTTINHSGEITKFEQRSHPDEAGSHLNEAKTRVTGGRLPLEPHEVYTQGDATRVPQAHSDAVAKLRAEVMGL